MLVNTEKNKTFITKKYFNFHLMLEHKGQVLNLKEKKQLFSIQKKEN